MYPSRFAREREEAQRSLLRRLLEDSFLLREANEPEDFQVAMDYCMDTFKDRSVSSWPIWRDVTQQFEEIVSHGELDSRMSWVSQMRSLWGRLVPIFQSGTSEEEIVCCVLSIIFHLRGKMDADQMDAMSSRSRKEEVENEFLDDEIRAELMDQRDLDGLDDWLEDYASSDDDDSNDGSSEIDESQFYAGENENERTDHTSGSSIQEDQLHADSSHMDASTDERVHIDRDISLWEDVQVRFKDWDVRSKHTSVNDIKLIMFDDDLRKLWSFACLEESVETGWKKKLLFSMIETNVKCVVWFQQFASQHLRPTIPIEIEEEIEGKYSDVEMAFSQYLSDEVELYKESLINVFKQLKPTSDVALILIDHVRQRSKNMVLLYQFILQRFQRDRIIAKDSKHIPLEFPKISILRLMFEFAMKCFSSCESVCEDNDEEDVEDKTDSGDGEGGRRNDETNGECIDPIKTPYEFAVNGFFSCIAPYLRRVGHCMSDGLGFSFEASIEDEMFAIYFDDDDAIQKIKTASQSLHILREIHDAEEKGESWANYRKRSTEGGVDISSFSTPHHSFPSTDSSAGSKPPNSEHTSLSHRQTSPAVRLAREASDAIVGKRMLGKVEESEMIASASGTSHRSKVFSSVFGREKESLLSRVSPLSRTIESGSYDEEEFSFGKSRSDGHFYIPDSFIFNIDGGIASEYGHLRDLIPLKVHIRRSVIDLISERYTSASHRLLDCLWSKCALVKTFSTFRSFFLMEQGNVMHEFVIRLCNMIGIGSSVVGSFDLNEALREAWRDMLLDSSSMDVFQIVAPDDIVHGEETTIGFRVDTISSLGRLNIEYALPAPLKHVISEESMAGYQNLFRFFLQLRVSKQIMEQTFLRRGGAHERVLSQLRFEMLHIVNTLHQFIRDGIVADLWAKFNHDISNANDFKELGSIHDQYVRRMERLCLVSKRFHLVHATIMRILDLTLVLKKSVEAVSYRGIRSVASSFRNHVQFLMTILTKAVEQAPHSHLSDLLLRLNFNDYYQVGATRKK